MSFGQHRFASLIATAHVGPYHHTLNDPQRMRSPVVISRSDRLTNGSETDWDQLVVGSACRSDVTPQTTAQLGVSVNGPTVLDRSSDIEGTGDGKTVLPVDDGTPSWDVAHPIDPILPDLVLRSDDAVRDPADRPTGHPARPVLMDEKQTP